jgi:2'-5' RNA ligase
MTGESALIVLIPEAERVMETFRTHYIPAAASVLPAHVTILYPFKSPNELTSELSRTLHALFLEHPRFTATFREVQRFPDMLYLAPEPDEPFRQLTEAIVSRFPETPPYGGAFTQIIPHLTLAQVDDPQELDKIEADFRLAIRDMLPFHARIKTVTLMEDFGDHWQVREKFLLHTVKPAA